MIRSCRSVKPPGSKGTRSLAWALAIFAALSIHYAPAFAQNPGPTPAPALRISHQGVLTITEGASRSFSVSLTARPQSDVAVSLSVSNTNITLSKTSLTFEVENYATAQSITVEAAEDDDATDGSSTITLAASGGLTSSLSLSVSIEDDETVGFLLDLESLTVMEGLEGRFRVKLATQPSDDVTVSFTTSDADSAVADTQPFSSGNQSSFTFTRFGNDGAWDRYKPVVVKALRDADSDNESVTISFVGAGGDYQGVRGSVPVSITDGDRTSGTILLSGPQTLTILEGTSEMFAVRLSGSPIGEAIVSLSKTSSALNLSPSSLTFDASNYSLGKLITVSTSEDDDDTNESDEITIKVVSGGFRAPPVTKSVSVFDSDAEVGFDLNPASLSLNEGAQGSFQVRLANPPSTDITVNASVSDSSIVIDTDPLENGNQSALQFNRGQVFAWHEYRTVRIEARHDDDSIDESVEISLRGANGNYAGETASVRVSVTDDDRPFVPPPIYAGNVVISPSILSLGEGERAYFSVALDRAPASNVMIALSNTNPDVSLAPNSITFTESSWSKSVDVAVVASEDTDTTSDSDTIAFTLVDPIGLAARNRMARSLAVFVMDNDSAPQIVPIKTQALAIPPPDSGDDMTLRIRCNQDSPCSVILDCSTQVDGSVYEGPLPEAIPGFGARSLSADDIRRYTGWMPSATLGRLGCALRSTETIGSQVWTRSGADVLVNNSAFVRSVFDGREYRADIESIPSPDSFDESNIRIRCNSSETHCGDIRFVCYTDDGARYETAFEGLVRKRTLHLQSETLATRLGTRWPGLGLACELRAAASFTVQVLTRTGGGGALINNSATGSVKR